MAIFLKKFETMSQYNAYTADTENFILPNVSLTVDSNTVHYNPSTPPTPSHDYVEIGGVKWATMNIGANSVTDTGLYFQWGDTQGYTAEQVGDGEGKKYFDWEDYKYAELDPSGSNGSGSGSGGGTYKMTKYNETDGKTVLDLSDDAARANWGGSWRMPTEENFNALLNATTKAWTSITDSNVIVSGWQFTDKTDNTKVLFFPACGICGNGGVYDVGSSGDYWSSSIYTSNVVYGWHLGFISTSCFISYNTRSSGYSVRPVLGE